MTNSLFRQEALQAASGLRAGAVLLTRPPMFTLFTACSVIVVTGILALVLLGAYTRRTTVVGHITYSGGVSQIYPPEHGVLARKVVSEGHLVKGGEVLFVVRTQRAARTRIAEASISLHLRLRLQRLNEEKIRILELAREKEKMLEARRQSLRRSQVELGQQVAGQEEKALLAHAALGRYKELAERGYVSGEFLQQKALDEIDQRNRAAELRRSKVDSLSDLDELAAELRSLPLHTRNQVAQIDRAISTAEQELAEGGSTSEYEVVAESDGVIAATSAEIGQAVDPGTPLGVLLPPNGEMVAVLFAQSKDVGFVKENDTVALRLEAFPYQKFGHLQGRVIAVSSSPLSTQQLAQHVKFMSGVASTTGVALYKITVRLDRDRLSNDIDKTIQLGMKVDADIFHESRRIYEWILQPAFALKSTVR